MKKDLRTERLCFRVTKKESVKIRKYAKTNKVSLSDAVVQLISEKLFYLDH